jgi:hypothetical protein
MYRHPCLQFVFVYFSSKPVPVCAWLRRREEDSSRRRPSLQSLLGMCDTEENRLLDRVQGLLSTMLNDRSYLGRCLHDIVDTEMHDVYYGLPSITHLCIYVQEAVSSNTDLTSSVQLDRFLSRMAILYAMAYM